VPYELSNEGPDGGVFITPQTAFTMWVCGLVRSWLEAGWCGVDRLVPILLVRFGLLYLQPTHPPRNQTPPPKKRLSLFNVLRFPLVVLPKALRCVSEAINAASNIEKFLAEQAAPKHDTEGQTGVSFHNVRAWGAAAFCVVCVSIL